MEAPTSKLSPRDQTDTLPTGLPLQSLGYGAILWMSENLKQPNGPHAGEPFICTPRQQQFLVHYYAVDDDGNFVSRRGVRRLAKGSGKSPFAAAIALFELVGPCRFDHWENTPQGRVPVGKPVNMPVVQIAAVSEKQTANTMRMVRAFSAKGTPFANKYGIEVNKTFLATPGEGLLEQVTSSAHTLEGAEVSAVVCDEVEHWLPAHGGPQVMRTIIRNAGKVPNSHILETCNAWIPGEGSTAEATWEAFCLQEEGRKRGEAKILYDAIVAPHNAVLTDDAEEGQTSVTDALKYVYQDCPWIDIRQIKEQIWSPDIPETDSLRFFFNRPSAAELAWVKPEQWSVLADTTNPVADGEDIVMFFDGSKSDDHTALVGCRMSDGHVFVIGHWRPEDHRGTINVGAVDRTVRHAFNKWHVLAFYADVRWWESFVQVSWPKEFRSLLLLPAAKGEAIAWDMRTHGYQFAEAVETALAEIEEGVFSHDGNADLSQHVANARVFEFRGLWSIRKESPASKKKIDLAVCMVGARMLYRRVLMSQEYKVYLARKSRKGGLKRIA